MKLVTSAEIYSFVVEDHL